MGAAKPTDFKQVIGDTAVQEKPVACPTEAKLMHRASERLIIGTSVMPKHFKRVNRDLKPCAPCFGR